MPTLPPKNPRSLASQAIAFASCILAVLTLAAHTSAEGAAPPKPGLPFPALDSFGLEGKPPETMGKIVLVDFWASWCGPCKKSFPVMKELHETFGSRGFMVVAISLDEKKADMEAFLKKAKPPFVTLRDPKGKLAEALAIDSLPTSILIGSDGKVIAVHSGFEGESTHKDYLKEIEAALKSAGR